MSTQAMLDDRYGRVRSRRSRMTSWIVVGLLAALGVVALLWISFGNSANSVNAEASSYHVVDPRSVTVSFQLTAPAGARVVCALEADDDQHGIVGWRMVRYPPAQAHSRSLTETIPTLALATTGLVNTCWVS